MTAVELTAGVGLYILFGSIGWVVADDDTALVFLCWPVFMVNAVWLDLKGES